MKTVKRLGTKFIVRDDPAEIRELLTDIDVEVRAAPGAGHHHGSRGRQFRFVVDFL